jgi:hypothetical protein
VLTGERFMSMFDDYDEQAAKKAKLSSAADCNGPSADNSSSETDSQDTDDGPDHAKNTFRAFLSWQGNASLL